MINIREIIERKRMIKKYFRLIIRFLLAAIFIISGIGKLYNTMPAIQFLNAILPTFISYNVMYSSILAVSGLEIIIGLMLVFRYRLSIALPVYGLLIIVFTSMLGYAYFQQLGVADCGCFGSFDPGLSVPMSIVRNLVILILIVIAYLKET